MRLRFEGELNVDLNEILTNLVSFRRLYFMITCMLGPVVTPKKMKSKHVIIQGTTNSKVVLAEV